MRTCKKCGKKKEFDKFRKKRNRKKEIFYTYTCLECDNQKKRRKNPLTGKYAIKYGKGRSSRRFKDWKKSILERDNYKCVKCGSEKYPHCDHIVPWKNDEKLRFDIENGQVLCAACHLKKGRENNEILNDVNTRFKKGQKAINPFPKNHKTWNKGTKGLTKGFTRLHTEETKKKISESLKGNIPWNKGLGKVKNGSSKQCNQ